MPPRHRQYRRQQGWPMRLTATEIRKLGLKGDVAEAIVFDDDVPGFGVRLRAGGSRTFVFQYKLGSKQRRLTLGPVTALDLGKARDAARDLYAKVRLGGDPAGEKVQARLKAGETFEATAAHYLRHQQAKLRPRSYAQVQPPSDPVHQAAAPAGAGEGNQTGHRRLHRLGADGQRPCHRQPHSRHAVGTLHLGHGRRSCRSQPGHRHQPQ